VCCQEVVEISRLLDNTRENSARESLSFFIVRKFREILHYNLIVRISKAVISRIGVLAFHQSVKMHISYTLKNFTVKI